jgi:solute carrier family 13 (sodium-dependent dicarboxylate transporter), member 2/3/5
MSPRKDLSFMSEAVSATEERFDRWRRRLGFVLAPLALVITYFLTAPHLKYEPAILSGILACVGVLWVTESIPLPVSALLGALLCILFGVAPARTVLTPFADPIVFLFIGSFMLAQAMTVHRLDKRIALAFLAIPWVGGRPLRVMAMLGFVTAFLSMWLSNTATTAMMMPISLGILRALFAAGSSAPADDHTSPAPDRHWPYATGLMLIVAYAASIGGIGTPVGSPPNLIAIGQLRTLAKIDIEFHQWMAVMVPMLCVMFLVLIFLLYGLHRPPRQANAPQAMGRLKEYLRAEQSRLGPWTAGQMNCALVFALAVLLWMLPGFVGLVWGSQHAVARALDARLPESSVALLAAILLFCLPTSLKKMQFTLNWKQAADIDWGTILLFGGGLSLGSLMFSTGAAEAFGRSLTTLMGVNSLWGLTAVAIAVGIILSETTSNTAAANMVVPIFIALAAAAGVNPVPPVLGACLGASYGFMLPVSTPPNAIVYSSGLVPIPKMIRAGAAFDLIGFFVIFAGLRLLTPLMGWT